MWQICKSFFLGGLLLAAASASLTSTAWAQREIASWGGAYASAQQVGFVAPYNQRVEARGDRRNRLTLIENDGTLDELLNGDPPWYLIDLERAEVRDGCRKQLLHRLEDVGFSLPNDLVANASEACGVASVAWSQSFAVNRKGFEAGAKPVTLGDVFALDLFPGKRALPRSPEGLLELALLSTGARPAEVYQRLSNQAGIKTALDRLSELRQDIIWFESAREGLALVRDGDASIALLYSNLFAPLAANNAQQFSMIFDRQLIEMGFWAVPVSTPDRTVSRGILNAAMTDDALARTALTSGYGPTTSSALTAVPNQRRALMPTQAENLKGSFALDRRWWRTDGATARAAFDRWINSGS